MKIFNRLMLTAAAVVVAVACNEGIDDITAVPPGADETAPQITLKFPVEGSKIKVQELMTAVPVAFDVTDDIEVKSITAAIDGQTFATLTEFKDYRRVLVENLMSQEIANGDHVLTITATDIDNKTTTATANFLKEPPYVPVYANEEFYMSFDGDVGFKELVSFSDPTIVGTPTLATEGASGGSSYKGAADSYLTFPTTNLTNSEFSATFWMKVNATPDRAGILVMGPADATAPTAQNNRTSGFRFFRENAGGKQRFKLNVGDGTNEYWFDGGAAADVDPAANEWVNLTFTISQTQAVVYIDGEVVSQGPLPNGVSWTGTDILSIMSGAPRFTGWDHKSDRSLMDELRIFSEALTQEEVQTIIADRYEPIYDGELFYMSFNGNYREIIGGTAATVVGAPGFAGEGVRGNSYAGAAGSYLTFPTTGLTNPEFSAAFWMKVDATPDRAGVMVIGPPDPNLPATPNNRNSGFRFFRENAGGKQRFKLNVGTGTSDVWVDGGAAADVDPAVNDWVHLAFTISGTKAIVYLNGEVAKESDITGIDWTGCDILSIMSGQPRFTEWGHLSDESFMDELRIFDKALSLEEVQAVMDGN